MTSSQISTLPTTDSLGGACLPSADFIGSTSIIPELMQGFDGKAPTYEHVKVAMYSGRIPAVKVGGRWMLDRCHMREVAATFGMTPKAAPSARAPRAAVEHAAV